MAALLLVTGCHFGKDKEYSDIPGLTGAEAPSQATQQGADAPNADNESSEVMQPGQVINVSFSDLSSLMAPIEQTVRDDGTITLLYNQTFKAAGKTRGQLEKEIHDRYVPAFFVRLTVTVAHNQQTRFYYVGGEVKAPGRQIWIGPITVTRAIPSAGDFTDFANKKKVQLTRSNGHSQWVNCLKALENSQFDPQVYPGDKITVRRKIL